MPSVTVVAAVLLVAFLLYRLSFVGAREHFLPPGPPTIPLLGNLHIFPQFLAYHQFTEWARQYGDIFSLKIGSGTVVVLTSSEAIYEIMDKSSAVTSDRPPMYFVDVVTSKLSLVFSRYGVYNVLHDYARNNLLDIASGKTWRSLRKGAHEILTPKAAMQLRPIQNAESTQLMYEILMSPKDFYDSARRFSSSVILSVTYGKRAPRITSKEVTDFFTMNVLWEHLITPGSYAPVDFIPILKYFPERLAKWKAVCRTVRKLQRDLYFGLLSEVERRMENKETNGCFMESLLSNAEKWGFDREMAGHLGGNLIEAGSDTTSSFTQSLILALVAFPEVQKRAQEELDRVVGTDRAPVYEDLENLPYIRAIVNEVHRFRPNGPLIPHAAVADVTYRGYTIPAGTTIVANLWGTFHDPNVYDDPERFHPDRYLESEFGTKKEREKDLGRRNNLAFGFGRRICAGFNVGSYSTEINAMNLLWAFNFSPARNEKGEEVKPDIYDYAQALSSFPNRFDCTITPRSQEHARIIRKQFVESTPLFQAFESGISDADRAFVEKLRETEKSLLAK